MKISFPLAQIALTCLVTSTALGLPEGRSDLTGFKWPNSPEEGSEPIESYAETVENFSGFNQLIPYALSSPDQEDAGSCLYMSLTGLAEWWLARLNPTASREPESNIDLSERYMMNLAGLHEDNNGMKNWKTDSIYLYNIAGQGVLNSKYRFTKGWHVTDARGDYQKASQSSQGAEYTTSYNWIDDSKTIRSGIVKLPKFERDVIFADPESNQWNVGVMPRDIVEKVKARLVSKKAPVHVIYNHFGYWHAVNILGFDDELATNGCQFVTKFGKYMTEEPIRLREKASTTQDATARAKLLARADKFEKLGLKFKAAYQAGGGCTQNGMFYVRDSIYPDQAAPYDYDPSKPGTEGFYSKTVVVREYEWLEYMANHATQIYLD